VLGFRNWLAIDLCATISRGRKLQKNSWAGGDPTD